MTPSGTFQDRDASCCNLHDVLGMGLHDTNRLGDQPLHGYDADIIARDADRARIMEEVVTLAATGQ